MTILLKMIMLLFGFSIVGEFLQIRNLECVKLKLYPTSPSTKLTFNGKSYHAIYLPGFDLHVNNHILAY